MKKLTPKQAKEGDAWTIKRKDGKDYIAVVKKQRLQKGVDFDGWMVKWSDRQWHSHVWFAKKPEKAKEWEIHRVKIVDLGVVK